MFDPWDDGITHVNVYSRGRTNLGRLLSNFAHTPFQHRFREFASVEAWWYWHSTGRSELCELHGFEAKREGRKHAMIRSEPSREELLAVYQAKADQHPVIKAALRDNALPLDHYYVFGNRRQDTPSRWTGLLWGEVNTAPSVEFG